MDLTVAIMLGAPLTTQNLDRVHAEILSQRFKVIIVDCSSLVYPISADLNLEKLEWKNHLKINSILEFRDILEKEKISYALDFIGNKPLRNQVAKELRKCNAKLVLQKFGPLPSRITPKLRVSEIKNKILGLTPSNGNQVYRNSDKEVKNLKNKSKIFKIFFRLTHSFVQAFLLRLDNPYIVLQVKNRFVSWESFFAKKVIRIASNDFHRFNSEPLLKSEETFCASNYAVFVDDCLIESLDWRIIGADTPINKEIYFNTLNAFFDQIEIEHDVKVVIAGHPNTENNSAYNNNFMDRPVVYSKTCTLVQKAHFVMVHASTAVSYAVLATKPVFTITSTDIMKTHTGRTVQAMTYALGTRLVNLDSPPKHIPLPDLNKSKYIRYQESYIKSSGVSEEIPMENFVKFVIGRQQLKS